ncbi:MAG: PorP/SprF family type IX secretion system membrane protein [Brumimicrobium sp.]|nr:PorP/SprF family type IX secretion system membrane protein [Brumimicrobium sp.]
MNNMYKIAILFVCIFSWSVKAQQVPFYNQFLINPVVYNPASAGMSGDVNAYVTRGQRYVGFGSGAVNNTLSLEGPFFIKNSGFGLFVEQQSFGVMNQLSAKLTYSYTVQLGEDHKLGFGVSGGYLDNRLNLSSVNVMHTDDPFLFGMRDFKATYDFNLGVLYRWKGLKVGFSVPQLIGNKVKFTKKENARGYYTLARHFMGSVGYDFQFESVPKIKLTPYALVRYVPRAPFQYDIGAQFEYENIGWFSATYKSDYSVQFNIGFHIPKNIHVGYSYELVIGSLKNNFKGVNHEFLIGYTFKTKKDKLEYQEVQERIKEVTVEKVVPDPKVVKENEDLRKENEEKDKEIQRLKDELAKKYQDTKPDEGIKVERSGFEGNKFYHFMEEDKSDSPKGYYVVIGAFSEEIHVQNNIKNYKSSFPQIRRIYNTKNNLSYVIIFYSTNKEATQKELQRYKTETGREVRIVDYQ